MKSVYNEIGIATDDVVTIINNYFQNGSEYHGESLDSDLPGGYEKWKADMKKYEEDYDFISGPLKTGYNENHTMGILKNRPELYVRIALAMMKKARENGRFEALSDEEFNSLIGEFTENPNNFKPAARRAISVKYDKALQQDLAKKKGGTPEDHATFAAKKQQQLAVEEEKLMEDWTKRQWQLKAGIIK
jgi:hypothetical protein